MTPLVPGPPRDVKASSINSDTVLVSWLQPDRLVALSSPQPKAFFPYQYFCRLNGEILSYTLYKQYDRMVTTMTIPGSEKQFTFKGLVPR